MNGAAKIFRKNSIDSQNRLGWVFAQDHVAHRNRTFILAVLEIERSQYIGAYLVIDLSRLFPFGKQRRRGGRGCAIDELVLVEFLAALNDSVVYDFLDSLQNFAFGS